MKTFLTAMSFLTIFPLKLKNISEKEVQKCVISFPLIGALEGLILAIFILLTRKYFLSTNLSSIMCLLLLFGIRGIFHIDGLADTFDALFYKGSGDYKKDVEKRLNIMKDSTIGVGGVVAIIFDILFKFILIKELIEVNKSLIPFILTFCLSRWVLIPVMYHGKPAKNTGLGAIFIGKIRFIDLVIASFLPSGLLIYFVLNKGALFLLTLLPLSYGFSIVLKNFYEKKFNGITGDHLGATVEIFEIVFLLFWRLYSI